MYQNPDDHVPAGNPLVLRDHSKHIREDLLLSGAGWSTKAQNFQFYDNLL